MAKNGGGLDEFMNGVFVGGAVTVVLNLVIVVGLNALLSAAEASMKGMVAR